MLTEDNKLPFLSSFEMHIVDHCNLNCKGCLHYSPLSPPCFYDIHEFRNDLREMSRKMRIGRLRILGGEPLLHHHVVDFLVAARMYFPMAEICLVTNGILLVTKKKDFWDCLKRNNILIDLSCYPAEEQDVDRIKTLILKNSCKIRKIRNGCVFWVSLAPAGGENAKNSFKTCVCKLSCPNLRHGRMMVCPVACYLDIYNSFFNVSLPCDEGIDIYANTGKKILEYLQKPIRTCSFCKAQYRFFDWEKSKLRKEEWDVYALDGS